MNNRSCDKFAALILRIVGAGILFPVSVSVIATGIIVTSAAADETGYESRDHEAAVQEFPVQEKGCQQVPLFPGQEVVNGKQRTRVWSTAGSPSDVATTCGPIRSGTDNSNNLPRLDDSDRFDVIVDTRGERRHHDSSNSAPSRQYHYRGGEGRVREPQRPPSAPDAAE